MAPVGGRRRRLSPARPRGSRFVCSFYFVCSALARRVNPLQKSCAARAHASAGRGSSSAGAARRSESQAVNESIPKRFRETDTFNDKQSQSASCLLAPKGSFSVMYTNVHCMLAPAREGGQCDTPSGQALGSLVLHRFREELERTSCILLCPLRASGPPQLLMVVHTRPPAPSPPKATARPPHPSRRAGERSAGPARRARASPDTKPPDTKPARSRSARSRAVASGRDRWCSALPRGSTHRSCSCSRPAPRPPPLCWPPLHPSVAHPCQNAATHPQRGAMPRWGGPKPERAGAWARVAALAGRTGPDEEEREAARLAEGWFMGLPA